MGVLIPSGTGRTITVDHRLYGIAIGASDGWAVGDAGSILRHLPGGAWIPVSSPTDRLLWDVEVGAEGSAWAAGEAGVILHHPPATVEPSPTSTLPSMRWRVLLPVTFRGP